MNQVLCSIAYDPDLEIIKRLSSVKTSTTILKLIICNGALWVSKIKRVLAIISILHFCGLHPFFKKG